MNKKDYQRNKHKTVLKYNPSPNCNINIMGKYLDTLFNLKDTIIYIWLKDGNSFWYYLIYTTSNSLDGYIKGKNGWIYKPIKINKIAAYY